MCVLDCPDRGKCYLEYQAQCCPVYRVNCKEGVERIRNNDAGKRKRAMDMDRKHPIPGVAERQAIENDKILPAFMKAAKIERLKEVYG